LTRPVLVIFDIDGTVLDSAPIHHGIIAAVLGAAGLDVTRKPWDAYRNYTDRGVIDELSQEIRGRPVSLEELAAFDAAYRDAFAARHAATPVVEIAGARRLLDDLTALPSVHVAFATGSLPAVARSKLALLDIDPDTAILATSGDGITREAIVETAIALDRVILGDGKWDERTAANLGIPFVAVETGTYRFGDGPVLKAADLSGLTARDLVALAQPQRER
jgi:phosphoglycolate phosphatase-like HAD superfamily hydrolase